MITNPTNVTIINNVEHLKISGLKSTNLQFFKVNVFILSAKQHI